MSERKVLILGYGSIGKRHTRNLLQRGIHPFVLTGYPDDSDAVFITTIDQCGPVDFAIVATPTHKHLDSVEMLTVTGCTKVLIEKPVEKNIERAVKLREVCRVGDITVKVAYNLRFLACLQDLKSVLPEMKDQIRIVEIDAGQYLPGWRPAADYRTSYSARRDQGGGVDLDLSHEVDYMLWLFGKPAERTIIRKKISNLEIEAPDYYKAIYEYDSFLVDLTVDYIRPKHRSIRAFSEDSLLFDIDIVNSIVQVDEEFRNRVSTEVDLPSTYLKEQDEFLHITDTNYLPSLDEGIDVLRLLELE